MAPLSHSLLIELRVARALLFDGEQSLARSGGDSVLLRCVVACVRTSQVACMCVAKRSTLLVEQPQCTGAALPKWAQSGAARSCAEFRQRTGAGPDAGCAPTVALMAQGGHSDRTLVEEQISPLLLLLLSPPPSPSLSHHTTTTARPTHPRARILNAGRCRLIVAGAWKQASRTHLFEARAALLGLRPACSHWSLRGKVLSAHMSDILSTA